MKSAIKQTRFNSYDALTLEYLSFMDAVMTEKHTEYSGVGNEIRSDLSRDPYLNVNVIGSHIQLS